MWAWENWWDIVSDLSAIHRLADPATLPPQQVIDLAVRLPAYNGIVAARARTEAEDNMPTSTDIGEDRIVDSTTGLLGTDPVLGDLFDIEVIS